MNELAKALDELEKATTRLMKVSIELTQGTEKLNLQLQTLADTLKGHSQLGCSIDASDMLKHSDDPQSGGQSGQRGILSEIKRLLDGT